MDVDEHHVGARIVAVVIEQHETCKEGLTLEGIIHAIVVQSAVIDGGTRLACSSKRTVLESFVVFLQPLRSEDHVPKKGLIEDIALLNIVQLVKEEERDFFVDVFNLLNGDQVVLEESTSSSTTVELLIFCH